METKRKLEEIQRKRQEDEDLRAAVALQVRFQIFYRLIEEMHTDLNLNVCL